MDGFVFLVVLSSALMHATWNSTIKQGPNSFLESLNIYIWKIPLTLTLILILPFPHEDSWPFIAVSVFIHILYNYALAYSYQHNDITKVYPIFRGTPPLIILVFSYLFLNETISFIGWIAVIITSLGILSISFTGSIIQKKSILSISLVTLSIVTYSIIDGLGARASEQSFSYLAWLFSIKGSLYSIIIISVQGYQTSFEHLNNNRIRGIVTSLISFLSYSLILWAVTKAPIVYVAALRETSIIFVGIIGWLFLSEKLSKIKILSIIIIALGAVLLRLS